MLDFSTRADKLHVRLFFDWLTSLETNKKMRRSCQNYNQNKTKQAIPLFWESEFLLDPRTNFFSHPMIWNADYLQENKIKIAAKLQNCSERIRTKKA